MSLNPSVTMGLNVELMQGAKFDRFTPIIGMNAEIDASNMTVEEQIAAQKVALKKMWKELSDTIETLINEELDRPITWGK